MINENNVKRCCREDISMIENYEEAVNSPEVYDCHHRLEIVDGKVTSRKELKEQVLYWHRPAAELIFLSHGQHARLHNKGERHPMYGKRHTEEHRRNIAEANKGKHHSEEANRKNAEAHKGKHHSEETKRKISAAKKGVRGQPSPYKGKHWKLVDGKRVWY